MKKFALLFVLFSNSIFAQNADIVKLNLVDKPKSIEESSEKAIIRTNIIEGYFQEYYTKTYFNEDGFITKIENFNDQGEIILIDLYSYSGNKLTQIESKNDDGSFIKTKTYNYTENGYSELVKENDILISESNFIIDQNNNIIEEKIINLLDESITTTRFNEYNKDQLTKTTVKYGKDGYLVQYKYGKFAIPTEEIIYDLKNKLISKKLRKFDDRGNLVEENYFDSDGKLKTNSRIQYEFDANGNWIKRTQYANQLENPITHSKRTIKY